MRQSSRNALLVAIAVVVGYVLYRFLFPTPSPDRVQITNAIKDVAASAQAKSANGIMRSVSAHYVDDNGLGNDGLRLSLVRAFHNEDTVEVALAPSSEITITGDTAHSETYVSVKCQGNQGTLVRPHALVVLDWKKEETTKYFLFPTKEWRVVKASYGSYTFDF